MLDHSPRSLAKLQIFWELCENLKGLSMCKRLKNGCVICPPDFSRIEALGYNGPPAGLSNHGCRAAEGDCGCVHAEANAIMKVNTGHHLLLLCTTSPCEHCAGLIINSMRIHTVIYKDRYRAGTGIGLLIEAGISVLVYDRIREVG